MSACDTGSTDTRLLCRKVKGAIANSLLSPTLLIALFMRSMSHMVATAGSMAKLPSRYVATIAQAPQMSSMMLRVLF